MQWRSEVGRQHLLSQGRRLFKGSALVPLAIGGSLLGAAASGGASHFSDDPYRNPKMDALKGAGFGALGAAGIYGLSRLPAWSILPMALAGGGGLLAMESREAPAPAGYNWSEAMKPR